MNEMRASRALAIALLSAVLAGCGGPARNGGAPTDSVVVDAPGAEEAAASADTAFQRGHVRVAGDSLFFTACGGTAEARLDDRTGGALARGTRSLGDGGQPVYVEFNGGTGGAGTVTAWTFLRASPVGEGGGCNRPVGTYLYHAFGEEPFWSVIVDEDSLVFLQPDEPARLAWAAPAVVATRGADGSRRWAVEASAGRPALALTIEAAPCTDGMSGEVTAFRSRATLGGRALEGCARAGSAADEVR